MEENYNGNSGGRNPYNTGGNKPAEHPGERKLPYTEYTINIGGSRNSSNNPQNSGNPNMRNNPAQQNMRRNESGFAPGIRDVRQPGGRPANNRQGQRPVRPGRTGAPGGRNPKAPVNMPKKKKASVKEKVIITLSIILGVIILAVLILNIPIIPVERTKGDRTYTERISIIRYIKELQPLADVEGLLSEDTNSYELVSGAEVVDDKREFTNDQIIEGQFTVLVLGFDESRELSDVMMLCLFDIYNHKLDILQIPRDSFVPDYTSSETGKINSVYKLGDQDLIPIQRTVNAVRETFGIPIDRYVTTGCDDIVEIVDIIGGIPINLPENVFYSYDKILYAGEQVLDGYQAELMLRARKGYNEGDIGRVKAQRIFLAACMEKALDMGSIELTSFISEIYDKKLIATDMTLGELSILADFGTLIDMDKVTVQLVPGEGAYNGDYSVWSIHKNATVDVLNEYFRPYQVDLGYDDLPIYELVTEGNYLTDMYDENQDTLQDIADGAKPGENKKQKPTEEQSYGYEDDYGDGEYNYGY